MCTLKILYILVLGFKNCINGQIAPQRLTKIQRSIFTCKQYNLKICFMLHPIPDIIYNIQRNRIQFVKYTWGFRSAVVASSHYLRHRYIIETKGFAMYLCCELSFVFNGCTHPCLKNFVCTVVP